MPQGEATAILPGSPGLGGRTATMVSMPRSPVSVMARPLPVVAIAQAAGFGGGGDQFLVFVAQHDGECVPSSVDGQPTAVYFDNSLSPSRISGAVSAPSPAMREAPAMAAAACGGP